MEKIRKVVTEVKYEVCDLCGGEITASNGNIITIKPGTNDEKEFVVHLMDAGKEGCVHALIVKALKK